MPIVHQLRQPHTGMFHATTLWWPWDNITHVNWRKWIKNEARMVSPRPNDGLIWENWRSCRVCWSWKYPNPRVKSGQCEILTDSQNWRNGKILWAVGRNTGWPEELADFQGSLRVIIQALSDPQEIHRRCPCIWIFKKTMHRKHNPKWWQCIHYKPL